MFPFLQHVDVDVEFMLLLCLKLRNISSFVSYLWFMTAIIDLRLTPTFTDLENVGIAVGMLLYLVCKRDIMFVMPTFSAWRPFDFRLK